MNKPFRFKQFTINQNRCAMKIGTDGVLLGAITQLRNEPQSILDVGAGTGIVALMMAQRSDADTIDAVELDGDAYEQCVDNFEASPWADRLFCYHASFHEFTVEMEESYDLIVSNPPFFSENVTSKNNSRDRARQNSSLPFVQLIEGVNSLLSKNGIFSLVIPMTEENNVVGQAAKKGLYPFEILRVKGNPKASFKRSILQFSYTESKMVEKELIIELERHQFTQEYIRLTKDFYLKM
jgi:tRNA1Val (adenine37-N6)-methyltransferase